MAANNDDTGTARLVVDENEGVASSSSPSKLTATAKIALFEMAPKSRRKNLAKNSAVNHQPQSMTHHSQHGQHQTTLGASSRPALRFLSPNAWKKSQSDAQLVQSLQNEIVQLQERIEILDGDTQRNELLDLVAEKEQENRQLEKKLHLLIVKLEVIQEGLCDIETERQSLTSQVTRLQEEHAVLQGELELRERELALLSKRCSSQSDRIRESATLSTSNRELRKEMEILEEKLQQRDKDSLNSESIRRELQACRQEKDEILARMKTVKENHDAVVDNLKVCLANLDKLTKEKQEWEEERRRIEERVELTREQQRLEHAEELVGLKEDVQVRDRKVKSLQEILHDKESKLLFAERHVKELMYSHSMTVDELQNANSQLKEKYDYLLSEHRQTLDRDVDDLRCELHGKDELIDMLQQEFAATMDQLMEATSCLQSAEEDRALCQSLTSDIENLEHARLVLSETLHERDMEVAELSAEILKLEIEKELVRNNNGSTSALELRAQLNSIELERDVELDAANQKLQQSVDRIQELESKLEHFNAVCEPDYASKVSGLEAQLADRLNDLLDKDNLIASLNSQLAESKHQSQQSLLAAQEEKQLSLARLTEQHSEEILSLRAVVESLRSSCQEQEGCHQKSMEVKDKVIASIKKSAHEAEKIFMERHKEYLSEIASIREELQDTKTKLAIKDDEYRDLQMIELHDSEDRITALQNDLAKLRYETESEQVKLDHILQVRDSRIAQLEAKLGEQKDEYEQVIFQLMDEKEVVTSSEHAKEKRLKQVEKEFVFISEKLSAAEQSQMDLKAECRQLRVWVEKSTSEKENLAVALKQDREQQVAHQQDAESVRQHNKCLREDLKAAELSLVTLEEHLAKLESALQDRTKQLNDMVTQYEEVKVKLTESRANIDSVQQEANDSKERINELEDAFSRARNEWRRKEDRYMDDFNTERNRLEIAEAELMDASSRLCRLQESIKDADALEKENEELKDKVRRQEAYLKRKLEKEKALKIRSQPKSTPARTAGVQVAKPPRSVTSARVTRSTASVVSDMSSSSLDWELDCLLAD